MLFFWSLSFDDVLLRLEKKQHRSHATLFQRGSTQKFSFSIKISFSLKLTSTHKWELAYLGACQSVCCVFFTLKIDFSFINLVQNGIDWWERSFLSQHKQKVTSPGKCFSYGLYNSFYIPNKQSFACPMLMLKGSIKATRDRQKKECKRNNTTTCFLRVQRQRKIRWLDPICFRS